jgi:hypothetical protein
VRGPSESCPECRRLNRNAAQRDRFESSKFGPSVYAVYFPSVGLLKVGFTTGPHYVGANRAKARESFGATDGKSAWLRTGDYRTESFAQAWLAFRYPQPDHDNGRLAEWFIVGDREPETLAAELDEILTHIPRAAPSAAEVLAAFRDQHAA